MSSFRQSSVGGFSEFGMYVRSHTIIDVITWLYLIQYSLEEGIMLESPNIPYIILH